MNNDWDPLVDYVSHKDIIKSYDSISGKISDTVTELTKLSNNNQETNKEIDKLITSIKHLVSLQHNLRDKIEKLEENHDALNNKISLVFDNQKQFFELLQKDEEQPDNISTAFPFMSNYASLRARNYYIRQNKPFKFVAEHADKKNLQQSASSTVISDKEKDNHIPPLDTMKKMVIDKILGPEKNAVPKENPVSKVVTAIPANTNLVNKK